MPRRVAASTVTRTVVILRIPLLRTVATARNRMGTGARQPRTTGAVAETMCHGRVVRITLRTHHAAIPRRRTILRVNRMDRLHGRMVLTPKAHVTDRRLTVRRREATTPADRIAAIQGRRDAATPNRRTGAIHRRRRIAATLRRRRPRVDTRAGRTPLRRATARVDTAVEAVTRTVAAEAVDIRPVVVEATEAEVAGKVVDLKRRPEMDGVFC